MFENDLRKIVEASLSAHKGFVCLASIDAHPGAHSAGVMTIYPNVL